MHHLLVILSTIGGLTLIDLILSGDNALVIGTVAAKLPRRKRLLAIIFGGGCAIILRVLFTICATLLLQIPLVQIIGAIIVFYIAIKLLRDRDEEQTNAAASVHHQPHNPASDQQRKMFSVMSTIVVADVSMSLDNVLAIGALAAGNFVAIAFGLLLSILILLAAATIVAELVSHFTWLLDLAALVLAWTAANMALNDGIVGPLLEQLSAKQVQVPVVGRVPVIDLLLYGLLLVVVILIDIFLRLRGSRQSLYP
jgi:YjbE family integral membrane protein